MKTIINSLLKIYSENFLSQPNIYFSPGRINIIGEHVDYNDGFVMPAAIDKGIYFAIAPNHSSMINFIAIDQNDKVSIGLSDIKKLDGWKNYVLSVVNEFILAKKKVSGFDCAFTGDIPIGAGMSSSAAVEGGLAFGLNEIFNCGFSKPELAQLCQRAEHNFPGVQCGIMDQFANMMGRKDQVIFLDCKDLSYKYLPLDLGGHKIVLLNTKVHHSLGDGEYNYRRKKCEEGLMILGQDSEVHSFRDIAKSEDLARYEGRMGEMVYNFCRYVVEEIGRAKEAAKCLSQNNIEKLGELMFETHHGLSVYYTVSCNELDFLVDIAKKDTDVIGARMMGGGFGGCTINIVKEKGVDKFISNSIKAYHEKFKIDAEAYIVQTSDGVTRL